MSKTIEHWQVRKAAIVHAEGMVAAQHYLAARAGAALLHDGGNAVDAAVAAALALGAVEPWMCGLGGSGLMVVWLAGEQRAVVLDFQGVLAARTAPEAYPIDPDLPETLMGFPTVRGNANVEGYRSITVPGAAAGFDHAIRNYGSRPLKTIAAPAIQLARAGLSVEWFAHLQISLAMGTLQKDAASADVYLPDGRPALPESRISIPGLADTLEAYGAGGAADFYQGDLARAIVADLASGGSTITGDDFAAYSVLEAEVLESEHRGTRLFTPGATSGGQRLRDCLAHIASHLPAPPVAPTPETWATYAAGLELAWRNHNRRIGRETEVGTCTSHLSTVDRHGNMVALTHTLLNRFGSGVTLPATGLMMNNAVSYFDPRPGYPTTMAPRMRINASNMCPTIAVRGGRALFAIGASGGNHIMPAVAQVAALMLDFGMDLEAAINMPRLDASNRGSGRVDPALGGAVITELGRHYTLEIAQRLVFPKLYACVSGVSRSEDGSVHGLNDPSLPIGGASGPMAFPTGLGAADPEAGVRA